VRSEYGHHHIDEQHARNQPDLNFSALAEHFGSTWSGVIGVIWHGNRFSGAVYLDGV
jgi:hypothetical protein